MYATTNKVRLCLAGWLALFASPAGAEVVILHSFAGGTTDGEGPLGSLTEMGSNLYGTASGGGSADLGVVFEVGIDGSGYQVAHSFGTAANDGAVPFGSLTANLSAFYGTTFGGGGAGQGNVYKIGADGTGYTNLHSFTGGPGDGSAPVGSLALSGSTFFGTTSAGGSSGTGGGTGDGTIFKINADGTGYSVLHSFLGGPNDGQDPQKGAQALSGNTIYGMTISGGSTDSGVVYKIGTDGTGFTVLHSFTFDPGDGNTPAGSVILSGATLYGMTTIGGAAGMGTIFKMGIDGTGFTLLHSFGGAPSDGNDPLGELLMSGSTLYGTTYRGGGAGDGTLFSINTDGTGYDTMYSFAGGPNDGANPGADLIQIGSTFYGTTAFGGANNDGTVFSFTPVPEPSSLLLAAAGALAFFAGHRFGKRPS